MLWLIHPGGSFDLFKGSDYLVCMGPCSKGFDKHSENIVFIRVTSMSIVIDILAKGFLVYIYKLFRIRGLYFDYSYIWSSENKNKNCMPKE